MVRLAELWASKVINNAHPAVAAVIGAIAADQTESASKGYSVLS